MNEVSSLLTGIASVYHNTSVTHITLQLYNTPRHMFYSIFFIWYSFDCLADTCGHILCPTVP